MFADVNKQQKTEQLNEIGQMLVPGALNDTKKIRKAVEWLQVPLDSEREYRYATYRASW